jgi:hypothetical protein
MALSLASTTRVVWAVKLDYRRKNINDSYVLSSRELKGHPIQCGNLQTSLIILTSNHPPRRGSYKKAMTWLHVTGYLQDVCSTYRLISFQLSPVGQSHPSSTRLERGKTVRYETITVEERRPGRGPESRSREVHHVF